MMEHTEVGDLIIRNGNPATQPLRIQPESLPVRRNVPIRKSTAVTIDTKRIARRVLALCLLAEMAFVALDYHINYGRLVDIGALRRLLNIAREDGLASWFDSAQTLLAGLTLLCIYFVVRKQPRSKWRALGWLILSCFFIYMAIADVAQIHERLGTTFQALREQAGASLDFFPSYAWIPLFLPPFGILVLFLAVFLWRELTTTASRAFLLVAMSCFVVAVGLVFIEGLNPDHPWSLHTLLADRTNLGIWSYEGFGRSAYDAARHFSKSIQETLDMLGISILWFLFIRHLGRMSANLQVQFKS